MPKHALLVHGYSEQFLNAYGTFPDALKATAPELEQRIVLSAFDSLDDGVTIDDLARGLEQQMQALEQMPAWDTSDAAVFCHSTGALVVRRWILNRLGSDAPLPTHLITLAGANHGSSLAQLGRTALGYLHDEVFKRSATVGARVLIDLDYGSDFLFALNADWLDWRFGERAKTDGRLQKMYVFSLGGDSLGRDTVVRAIWASSERGCDNTVRISGANLNYTMLSGNPAQPGLVKKPRGLEPHLIVPAYSHYGPDTGIMAACKTASDPPMRAIREALDVADTGAYATLAAAWQARCGAWADEPAAHANAADPDYGGKPNRQVHQNSTIVFRVRDWGGHTVDDCYIGLLDGSNMDASQPMAAESFVERLLSMSDSLASRQPIHNDVARGSYTFYVNTDGFNAVHHLITIAATEVGLCVPFVPVAYEYVPQADGVRLVNANEVTYVDVEIWRDPSQSYAMYENVPRPENEAAWRPFPPTGRIQPPPSAPPQQQQPPAPSSPPSPSPSSGGTTPA